ncbi:protein FANTASTIC FOUR 3-like [Solanum dulcamara]|uniref:protein FANTASTIC FOUR 3-like n=1 Tax=Solanum dulcamara TaxID=45834 RepID=UPI002485A278|nr:protein FANTASTIC FOUR 3-like [Solanum dulcamara]
MTSTSTLHQGLQSCLEPTLVMNKLAPPRSNFPQPMTLPQKCKIGEIQEENDNVGGWSFIQALAIPCQNSRKGDPEEEAYVPPLVKLSSLNTKSLKMCTESLGSETGSDITENIEEFSCNFSLHGVERSKCREFAKKINKTASFPPPLTSMNGNEGVQIRPHREGGRLVLKAMSITCCNSNFRVERANGRLKLSLLKHDECTRHGEEDAIIQENDEFNENCSRKLASDIGVGEYSSRPTRCNASGNRNKGIPCWEPVWVAIS